MNFILLMMLYLITDYLRYISFTVTYPNILRIKYKTKNYRGVIRVVIHITNEVTFNKELLLEFLNSQNKVAAD
jgi:hypothetical protein